MIKNQLTLKRSNFAGRTFNRCVLFIALAGFSLYSTGCHSSKKAAAAKAAEEARLAKEREERLKKEEAERLRKEKEENAKREPYNKLNTFFSQIASAPNADAANQRIQEALTMFSSPDAPLLIVISKQGENKDYDKPTTVKKYLEYVKDQKKNANKISNLVFDENGKIKEVELTK